MVTATITSKGQITIPKTVRNSLHLHTGDKVAFILQNDSEAVIKPVTKSVEQVFGRLHHKGMVVRTVEDMNRAIARRMRSAKP
ncbi:MAG TPA: AbrB/MazE/SpoVT family DNA-binding domain-containing protein [Kiritimatiellia bacterium]|nr:AbrB/MazE/SpoVT family DNA-binding domain-containing protein [Kiritimatiellia bacterium]